MSPLVVGYVIGGINRWISEGGRRVRSSICVAGVYNSTRQFLIEGRSE